MGNHDRKNVIVVGAGASKEFDLPTGEELKGKIASIANVRYEGGTRLATGDYRVVECLKILAKKFGDGGNISHFLREGHFIYDNMPLAPSIDNFLDTHRQRDRLVAFGKLAIAKAILDAEKTSKLYIDPRKGALRLNFGALTETWAYRLYRILIAQRQFEDFITALDNIVFISFNYDRCISQFFMQAAQSYFALDYNDAQRVLASIKIIYPYGSLGSLGGRDVARNGFGSEPDYDAIVDMSYGIKTFTEGAGSKERELIREALLEVELVVFLGFSFLPLNMDMLIGGERFAAKRVIATGKGLSANSRSLVKNELTESFIPDGDRDAVSVVDCKCAELFHEFERLMQN